MKSLRRTSQYMPHSSGRVGTKAKRLQGQSLQAVFCFLPKRESLCCGKRWPQKHLENLPRREHSDRFSSFQ